MTAVQHADDIRTSGGETLQLNPPFHDQAVAPSIDDEDIMEWSKSDAYRVEVRFQAEHSGGFSVYSPELPGAVSEGETFEEARRNIEEALSSIVSSYRDAGESIPWVEDAPPATKDEIRKWIIFRA